MNELDCGDLSIKFVDKFELAWWDKGSGGKYDGAYYKPIVPQGYYALGYYGQSNYNSPAGAVVVVKDLKSGALARPKGYELIWKDKGSGADMDGAFWRPIPPSSNYVALGLVVTRNYNEPSVNEVMCVRQDLVVRGEPGDQVWIDKGTGADADFGSWEINSPSISGYEEYAYIAAGTFYGVASHNRPNANPSLYCLKVKLPFEKRLVNLKQPTLESTQEPAPTTEPQLANSVWIPFLSVKDDLHDLVWRVNNSPFYRLDREEFYTRQWHYFNNSEATDSKEVSVKVGVSKTDSEKFSVVTGISITTEASGGGIANVGFSSKVSVTLSLQLGYESSSSFTQMREDTVTDTYNIPGYTAVALWTKTHKFTLRRSDGSIVGNSWEIQTNSTVKDQFTDGEGEINPITTNITLQADNGQYVCAEDGGGRELLANRDRIGPWETFGMIKLGDNKIALRADNGQYVCAEGGGGGEVVANRDRIGSWETFNLITLEDGKFALQAANGQYVCAEGGGGGEVVANRDRIGSWETFK
ncbi:MAG: Vps62-related protein [Okeania sp. SIO3B5]|uniref:Vps62-related protein n=1 Tax=Okeania sp. SIO3B5 TaxID=2607811 RepID=UPI001400D99F|nr:Vps62-related protein [Okeania sp. SIO3B5]NEO53809.1 Vps62-related protein [Okeania sp. SIO3B5]